MKLRISDFEVEIKARFDGQTRYNKEATLYLLNSLAILAGEASERYTDNRTDVLAKSAKAVQDQLYNFCKDNGAYDNY